MAEEVPALGNGFYGFWTGDGQPRRKDNRYPNCSCPDWRYCPWMTRPTDPACPTHGEHEAAVIRVDFSQEPDRARDLAA